MGMLDPAFGVFCDGLASNTSLQVLDLRNNQITHEGAVEIGAALKQNSTLRAIGQKFYHASTIH